MSKPEDVVQLHAEIAEAVAGLDKENPALWTKDKAKAQVEAISNKLGYEVTAAERDAAVPPLTTKEVPALEIASSKQGFRRAGYSFGVEPVVIPLTDLSKEQINMLENEPLLAVSKIKIKADAE